MKNKSSIIIIVFILELLGMFWYLKFYLEHFNQFSKEAAGGLVVLLIILLIFTAFTPSILKEIID